MKNTTMILRGDRKKAHQIKILSSLSNYRRIVEIFSTKTNCLTLNAFSVIHSFQVDHSDCEHFCDNNVSVYTSNILQQQVIYPVYFGALATKVKVVVDVYHICGANMNPACDISQKNNSKTDLGRVIIRNKNGTNQIIVIPASVRRRSRSATPTTRWRSSQETGPGRYVYQQYNIY